MFNIQYSIFMLLFLFLSACGGGGGSGDGTPPTGEETNQFSVSSCTPTGDDSSQNNDGSANFVRSHVEVTARYGAVITRLKDDNSEVFTDYMVHDPAGTPKAIFVLIAGGNLRAGIRYGGGVGLEGVAGDGENVTGSRGNFLVRSAHRFMAAGYRVITIDRPSDYIDFLPGGDNEPGYKYDAYRNSMLHAVDLATVISRENVDNLPVIISGTSRGAISAVSNNTLAAGLVISSPLTVSSVEPGSTPVGSEQLPISTIKRETHVLIHSSDTCDFTPVENSRTLLGDIKNAGITASGDEVSGGFRDTVRNDLCGAFDYHGFSGIENCAVSKETTWADEFVANLASSDVIAIGQSVNLGDDITLNADGTGTLTFSLPYATTVLGGSVSVNPQTGAVTYNPPEGVNGTEDSFAFVVENTTGGVGRNVVRINIPGI